MSVSSNSISAGGCSAQNSSDGKVSPVGCFEVPIDSHRGPYAITRLTAHFTSGLISEWRFASMEKTIFVVQV